MPSDSYELVKLGTPVGSMVTPVKEDLRRPLFIYIPLPSVEIKEYLRDSDVPNNSYKFLSGSSYYFTHYVGLTSSLHSSNLSS